MSLLKYMSVVDKNKLPQNPEFKEANAEVEKVLNESPKPTRGKYSSYSPQQRLDIGKYAAEHGPSSAVRKFSPLMSRKLNESTVRGFKKDYLKELGSRKRKLVYDDSTESDEMSDINIEELPTRKRGRKLLMGEELDSKIQSYVKKVRNSGGVINTTIVQAAARGIVVAKDRSLLADNGGHISITRDWALSLLQRMNFVKRKGTTSKKANKIENFDSEKEKFLKKIKERAEQHNVPPELIINWDQTGLHVVPVSQWTMAEEGSKRIEISGVDDKRQITATLAGALDGTVLPVQLIYQGKTSQCHPKFKFPKGFHITESENHWANQGTMFDYVDKIIKPYVSKVIDRKDLPLHQKAIVIFECFRAQITDDFLTKLTQDRLVYITIPPNCTDLLQPMDLSVNKSVKHFLKSQFENWYAEKITKDIAANDDLEQVKIDLSLIVMKPLGAKWITKMYDYITGVGNFINKVQNISP